MKSSVFGRGCGAVAISGLAALILVDSAIAQEYASGHGALEVFDEAGMATMPAWISYWLVFMLATFAVGLLFVWRRVEARFAVGGFLASFAAIVFVERATDLVVLSGLIGLFHLICWTPALFVLLRRRTFLEERSVYGVWTAIMTFVILFSFIFDIRDAAIYIDHMAGMGMLS